MLRCAVLWPAPAPDEALLIEMPVPEAPVVAPLVCGPPRKRFPVPDTRPPLSKEIR